MDGMDLYYAHLKELYGGLRLKDLRFEELPKVSRDDYSRRADNANRTSMTAESAAKVIVKQNE